jgi:hypothetical protein
MSDYLAYWPRKSDRVELDKDDREGGDFLEDNENVHAQENHLSFPK